MKVLVTGAAGRIGYHVSRLLLERGHEVRGFVLAQDPNLPKLAALGAEISPGRLEEASSVVTAVMGVDAVIHLAAALTSRLATDEQFFEANLRGTFNVLMAVRDHAPNAQRVISASSDAVYWSGWTVPPDYLPVDENHPLRPGTIYGAAKLGAEELCRTFWRAYGIPTSVARFSATAEPWELVDPNGVSGRRMFVRRAIEHLSSLPLHHSLGRRGPEDEATLEALRAVDDGTEQLFVVASMDGASGMFGTNDARDAAVGVLAMLDSPAAVGEAFNIGQREPHSEEALTRYVAERLGLHCAVIRTPHRRASWYITSAKAERLLGYRPTRTVFEMVDEAVAEGPGAASAGAADRVGA